MFVCEQFIFGNLLVQYKTKSQFISKKLQVKLFEIKLRKKKIWIDNLNKK